MTVCGVSFVAHVNCFQLICVTFDLHVNCPRFLTGWTTSEVFQCSLLSSRLLYCCFVDILVPRSLRRTTFRVCCNRYSAIMQTNLRFRQLKRQWGLPLFLAGQLRLHCRQHLRGSASHPTRGMLSTKNWAGSLGYATLSTSPRRTGKTRSHPPTQCGCVEPRLGTLRRYHAVGLVVCARRAWLGRFDDTTIGWSTRIGHFCCASCIVSFFLSV